MGRRDLGLQLSKRWLQLPLEMLANEVGLE
jgi:hypothetical protein